ncbi:Helix-turn-helix domain-containing protein [Eubacterium aggregans]|uniref:Helix-turn-helix domain-containing protein n=1 Tax=Eubacterium aggregans TaxID=81409 RepID=A0A1H4BPV5_9FIRM|nr:helix-turn-helix domain-containing protein [Eubacterium aggregans]SEA50104.1 Helix-turn-helix domain-containing protein [Eubacterium aggregans]
MAELTDTQFAILSAQMAEIIKILSNLKAPVADDGPLLMDVKEASAYTGLTKAKLYQYAKEMDGFPVVREDGSNGGRVFFSRQGLAEWVEMNRGRIIE